MYKKHKWKLFRFLSKSRNRHIEITLFGRTLTILYDPKTLADEQWEFTYKLQYETIIRLIKSYYEDIISMEVGGNVFSMGSSESSIRSRGYSMLNSISKQLDKHGLNGKMIIDEIYKEYFKDDFEHKQRYYDNHGSQLLMGDFKKCKDPLCCKRKFAKNSKRS